MQRMEGVTKPLQSISFLSTLPDESKSLFTDSPSVLDLSRYRRVNRLCLKTYLKNDLIFTKAYKKTFNNPNVLNIYTYGSKSTSGTGAVVVLDKDVYHICLPDHTSMLLMSEDDKN